MGAKLFGAAVKRLEDPDLLTGKGQYTDDIHVEGALPVRGTGENRLCRFC
jgi:CO/xanthine dehydrogenase Mo-binding subunit